MTIRPSRSRNRAFTDPAASDWRLRGRAYALPFGTVWRAALATAGEMRRWNVTASDPRLGTIAAEAHTAVWKFVDDVEVRISLDAAGQTRVDVVSASRVGRVDFGVNARRIARFLKRLDARLDTP